MPGSVPVAIVEYDPTWPRMFELEKARIMKACGSIAKVEHVGSTAVPGLGAKPIVDIMAGVERLRDAESCVPVLSALGYTYRPENEETFPERRFLDMPSYHLHIVELRSDFWFRHLLFRDYLRTHPCVARDYCELKRRLAAEHGNDREGYTEAKTSFILSALERAGYRGGRA